MFNGCISLHSFPDILIKDKNDNINQENSESFSLPSIFDDLNKINTNELNKISFPAFSLIQKNTYLQMETNWKLTISLHFYQMIKR